MEARQLAIGEEITMNGQRLRYVGDGRFEPVFEQMTKRFDVADIQPLHRPLSDGEAL
jgi:hypothetical protein